MIYDTDNPYGYNPYYEPLTSGDPLKCGYRWNTVGTRDLLDKIKEYFTPLKLKEWKTAQCVPGIKKVIFNDPATIIIWEDSTKTVVKCMEGDTYDKQTGLAMCICKKLYGDAFHRAFREMCKND